mmetsp:Transcript_98825/g.282554  ORF Transcript_98825/g.282554 Transcript_98825/m.282554 type:complete len:99 (-) Transcript_98825:391-687(-)
MKIVSKESSFEVSGGQPKFQLVVPKKLVSPPHHRTTAPPQHHSTTTPHPRTNPCPIQVGFMACTTWSKHECQDLHAVHDALDWRGQSGGPGQSDGAFR